MDQKKSILIIDDHPVFKDGLKTAIALDNRFKVVGEAENARRGLRMSKKYQPDIIVMAISLPDKSGIELTREIRNLSSKMKDIGHELLTPREQEILRLLAEGHSARKIAEKLCISPRTAENHRTHIMKKLGLHSTLDLVRYAARIGLIDLDLWIE